MPLEQVLLEKEAEDRMLEKMSVWPIWKWKHNENMNNKYFTPAIEDLRVGYEYEVKVLGISIENFIWTKAKIQSGDRLDYVANLIKFFAENNHVRVPYLTKEQIEAEGWEEFNYAGPGYRNKEGVGLKYNFETKKLNILKPAGGFKHEVFIGTCPSINELRYICKLLNVK